MHFSKWQGCGNDFVLVDCFKENVDDFAAFAKQVCDRHYGIGGDGVLYVLPSDKADFRMRIFNTDGSEAEMCGNGIRCFVKFIIEKGIVPTPDASVETLSGIKKTHAELSDGAVARIGVNMGEPKLDCADIPVSAEGDFLQKSLYSHGRRFIVSCVNTGIPHTVVFVDDVDLTDVEYYGRDIEHSPISRSARMLILFRLSTGRISSCAHGNADAEARCAAERARVPPLRRASLQSIPNAA